MRVRVYNKEENRYYVSDVLGFINSGYFQKYIVIDGPDVVAVDRLDKGEKNNGHLSTKVSVIDYHTNDNWIYRDIELTDDINRGLDIRDKENHFYYFGGYDFIYYELKLLRPLLTGKKLHINLCKFIRDIPSYDDPSWNYLRTSDDIRNLMKEFSGFHDSVIKKLSFESGSYVDEDRCMHFDDSKKTLRIDFDSQQSNPITIEFIGIRSLNLRPAEENYTPDIFGAYITRKDEMLYFFDDTLREIDESYVGTWIKSLEARWKYNV